MAIEDNLERARVTIAHELHQILVGEVAQLGTTPEAIYAEHASDSYGLGGRSDQSHQPVASAQE
jgi:hypothetical protein